MPNQAKNAGETYEEQAQYNAHSDASTDDGDQLACLSVRIGSGSSAAQPDNVIKGGADERDGGSD